MPLHDHRRGLHAAMAGNGNPYAILDHELLARCMRLHRGERVTVPDGGLKPLVAASLLTIVDGAYRPTFFIADREETGRVDRHARKVGAQLAARLLAHWPEIEAAYTTLSLSEIYPLVEMAFLLIGDRILDVGLLDTLAAETTLMPPAPARPSPEQPTARYYFWLIEGSATQLGQYGQRVTPLPWPDWSLITFGRYQRDAVPNVARDTLEATVSQAVEAGTMQKIETLASVLALPQLGAVDTRCWAALERACTADLLLIYQEKADELRALHASLNAGKAIPDGFGEFFCWYDHIAYAHAIDALAAAGVSTIPTTGFSAALWHETTAGTF